MPSQLSAVLQDRLASYTVVIAMWALTAFSAVTAKKKQWRKG